MNDPPWFDEVRAWAKERRFTWLDDVRRDVIRAEWLDVWSQVAFDPAFHDACSARLERCVPLVTTMTRERRLSRTESTATLVFDPEEPARVLVRWSHAMPSLCWSVAAPAELSDVFAVYARGDLPTRFQKRLRIAKTLGDATLDMITGSIDGQELWVDDAFWGSAHDDDPWGNVGSDLNMLALSVHVRELGAQTADRFPSQTCRTLWSKSTLCIEQHPRGIFVFEARYDPANDASAVAAIAERVDIQLPADLPMDVVASLLRGPSCALANVDEPSVVAATLRCALDPSSPATVALLVEAIASAASDAELGALAGLASSYRHDGLLFEIAERASGSLRAELEAFLRPPPP